MESTLKSNFSTQRHWDESPTQAKRQRLWFFQHQTMAAMSQVPNYSWVERTLKSRFFAQALSTGMLMARTQAERLWKSNWGVLFAN